MKLIKISNQQFHALRVAKTLSQITKNIDAVVLFFRKKQRQLLLQILIILFCSIASLKINKLLKFLLA
jgi:hypothetical protein